MDIETMLDKSKMLSGLELKSFYDTFIGMNNGFVSREYVTQIDDTDGSLRRFLMYNMYISNVPMSTFPKTNYRSLISKDDLTFFKCIGIPWYKKQRFSDIIVYISEIIEIETSEISHDPINVMLLRTDIKPVIINDKLTILPCLKDIPPYSGPDSHMAELSTWYLLSKYIESEDTYMFNYIVSLTNQRVFDYEPTLETMILKNEQGLTDKEFVYWLETSTYNKTSFSNGNFHMSNPIGFVKLGNRIHGMKNLSPRFEQYLLFQFFKNQPIQHGNGRTPDVRHLLSIPNWLDEEPWLTNGVYHVITSCSGSEPIDLYIDKSIHYPDYIYEAIVNQTTYKRALTDPNRTIVLRNELPLPLLKENYLKHMFGGQVLFITPLHNSLLPDLIDYAMEHGTGNIINTPEL